MLCFTLSLLWCGVQLFDYNLNQTCFIHPGISDQVQNVSTLFRCRLDSVFWRQHVSRPTLSHHRFRFELTTNQQHYLWVLIFLFVKLTCFHSVNASLKPHLTVIIFCVPNMGLVCVRISFFLTVGGCLFACMCLCLSVLIFLSLRMSACVYVCMSFCFSRVCFVSVSLCLYVFVSVFLSFCLCMYLSVFFFLPVRVCSLSDCSCVCSLLSPTTHRTQFKHDFWLIGKW